MIYSEPGDYSWYPSTMVSPWYVWFVELGYPNLDILKYEDGEWAIIEYYNSPSMPCMTKWNHVLYGLKNIEITKGFVTKYVRQLDLQRKQVWDDAEAKTTAAGKEREMLEQHAQDTAERAKNIIMGNDDLLQRVAKNGMGEIDPKAIFRHIPNHYKRV